MFTKLNGFQSNKLTIELTEKSKNELSVLSTTLGLNENDTINYLISASYTLQKIANDNSQDFTGFLKKAESKIDKAFREKVWMKRCPMHV